MGSIWDRMEKQVIYPASNREREDAVGTVLSNAHALTHWQKTRLLQALDAFPRVTLEDYERRVNQAVNAKNQLQSERDELQATINLQHQRLERATAIWRAEKPEERNLIMPDLGDLLDWLLDERQYWKDAAAHAYQEITKETRRAEQVEAERDRFKQRAEYVGDRWYEASKERDHYKADNDRLRNAIQEHKGDEKFRHVAYKPGQMESVADERLWRVLYTEGDEHEVLDAAEEAMTHAEWPEGVSDGLTIPCMRCGEIPAVDYRVDDDFWREVARPHERKNVVCIECLCRDHDGVVNHLEEIQVINSGSTSVFKPTRVVDHES